MWELVKWIVFKKPHAHKGLPQHATHAGQDIPYTMNSIANIIQFHGQFIIVRDSKQP